MPPSPFDPYFGNWKENARSLNVPRVWLSVLVFGRKQAHGSPPAGIDGVGHEDSVKKHRETKMLIRGLGQQLEKPERTRDCHSD